MHSLIGLLHGFWNQIVSAQALQPGVWSYFLLALLGLTQGYLVAVLGAVAAADGYLDPWMVFASISLGHLAADNAWYFLGRFWNINRIVRYGRKLGVRREYVERVSSKANMPMEKLVFLSKLTSGLTVPMLIIAGMSRLPWVRALIAMTLGEGVRTGALVFLGYHFALSTERLSTWMRVIAILGGLAVLWVFLYYLQKRTGIVSHGRKQ